MLLVGKSKGIVIRQLMQVSLWLLVVTYVTCACLSFSRSEQLSRLAYGGKFGAVVLIMIFSAFDMVLGGVLRIPPKNRMVFCTWLLWYAAILPAVGISSDLILASIQWVLFLGLGVLCCVVVPHWIIADKDVRRLNTLYMYSIVAGVTINIAITMMGNQSLYYINPVDGRLRYHFGFINPNFAGPFMAAIAIQGMQAFLRNGGQ